MESTYDLLATVMTWGSIAFVVWGASLAIGHMLSALRPGNDQGSRPSREHDRLPGGIVRLH
jgi:hypothetical protein